MAGGALSDRDLAAIRDDLEETWPGTAILLAPGTALSPEGGWSEGYSAAGTVPALVHPIDSSEAMLGGKVQQDARYVLSCPATTTLGAGWQVSYEGDTYEVAGVTEWGPNRFAIRAYLTRIGD